MPFASRQLLQNSALAILFSLLGGFAGSVNGAIQIQPTSLNPGDQYRLVFVTSTPNTPGDVSDISYYNTIVTSAANAVPELLALGTEWKVIGSSQAVSARENTQSDPSINGTGVPIFLLNSTLIANDYGDLWDGALQADLNITETGTVYNGRVWTGDVENGLGESQYFTHSSGTLFGNSAPSLGTTIGEIPGRNGWMFDWTMDTYRGASLYAMSGILTISGDPSAVPEPATLLTWAGLALTGLCYAAHRRWRQPLAA